MSEFLNRDPGAIGLSLVIILGWLGLSFVFLRLVAITIKKLLDALFKSSNN